MKNITQELIGQFVGLSPFASLYTLAGEMSNLNVTLSFNKEGRYILRKKWNRQSSEGGAITLRESGTYDETEQSISLTSCGGRVRKISKIAEEYVVSDVESSEDYNLDGWVLHAKYDKHWKREPLNRGRLR